MPNILTPERISFLFIFVSFAIFSTGRRNKNGYYVNWLTAVLYATLEILAQAALFGIVFYGLIFLIASFFPGRWGLVISLFLTIVLIMRPARQVTSSIEAFLAGSFGQKEKEDPFNKK